MAGRTRARGPRAHEAILRSPRMVERAGRTEAEFLRRYERAQTDLERFHVAVDFLRSAEAACYRAGVTSAEYVLRDATSDLLAVARTLTADLQARGRGKRQDGGLSDRPAVRAVPDYVEPAEHEPVAAAVDAEFDNVTYRIGDAVATIRTRRPHAG